MRFRLISAVFLCLNLMLCSSNQRIIEQQREKDPQYLYNVGLFYLNSNKLDESITYLINCISKDSQHFLALNALGIAYSMKGNFQESIAFYQKCLEINSGFTEARNNLGNIYQEMGFIDKANDEYNKAISDNSYNSRELPYYNLAKLRFAQDKLEEALDYVQKSLQIKSRLAMAHNLKGAILEKMDKLDEAILSYEQAFKIIPEELNFGFNLAVAYFKNKEFSKANDIFEDLSSKIQDPEMKNQISEYLKIIKEQPY